MTAVVLYDMASSEGNIEGLTDEKMAERILETARSQKEKLAGEHAPEISKEEARVVVALAVYGDLGLLNKLSKGSYENRSAFLSEANAMGLTGETLSISHKSSYSEAFMTAVFSAGENTLVPPVSEGGQWMVLWIVDSYNEDLSRHMYEELVMEKNYESWYLLACEYEKQVDVFLDHDRWKALTLHGETETG